MLPFVREEFALTRTEVGFYSTCFFVSAALLAVFTGKVVDKLGPKKGVLLGIVCMGATMLLYGLSTSYGLLLFFAVIAGLGFSIITPSVNKGVMIDAPADKRATSMGIMQSGLGVGGLTGASVLPIIESSFGWRGAIQFSAVFMLIMGLLVYKLYHEKNEESKSDKGKERENEKQLSLKESLAHLFTNKRFIWVCVLGGVLGASIGATISHFTVFLVDDLALSSSMAGLGLGIFQVGGVIGRPVWGWVSSRFFKGDTIRTLFVIGLLIGAMKMLFGLILNDPHVSLAAIFLMTFLLGYSAFGWQGVHFAAVGELVGEKQTGVATGLSLLFLRTGIFAAPPVFGLIADVRGNYVYSWILLGAAVIFISVIFYYFSAGKKGEKENRCGNGSFRA